MVGKLSLGDSLSLQEAGMIGLPDYVPYHVDADILEGLNTTFQSLVNSPFNCVPYLVGKYLDLGLNHQPEVSLAEWLAAKPNLECFPRAWCDSDKDCLVGNLDDLIDNEAEEDDTDMQVDKDEDVKGFDDHGEDVHSESDILIEGSIGHFFMNSKRYPKLPMQEAWFYRMSLAIHYSCLYELPRSQGFDLETGQFKTPPSAIPSTPASTTSVLPPPSTATQASHLSCQSMPSRDAVADEDMPQALSMLCWQVTGQLEVSGSGASGSQAGPGPSTERNLNLQILRVLDQMDLRLQRLEAAGTQPARHVQKGKKSKGKGKGKERARDNMDEYE
ncbi:uncharacterized protein C8Q71DRAFT_719273 [Rhodofomes roseus]|uniref:Uncharacterized protein n=1 Tax=Rhodofomes roseus TaxID=34475 RepID=A0ABQ8KW88_9APHY|nr:uncharacterized protein C8Q71DRAFT_719273 [Rhodofomes roseus]KAH9843491.1 hypothetical protein C8Q71DRAFT_719273 [Rhodofomes roseus]